MQGRYLSLMASMLFILPLVSLSIMSVQPLPTYAQEVLVAAPDLSGTNIYFSEAYQELSQFDRTESGISRYAGLLRLMNANLFTLEWRKGIPPDADLIVIAGPSSDLNTDDIARLWAYIQRGGRVLLIAEPIDNRGSVSRALGSRGLFELTWGDLGLQAREDVIVREGALREIEVVERDRNDEVVFEFSGEVPILETEFLTRRVDTRHPITNDLASMLIEDEEETANLNSLFFDGARSIEVDGSLQNALITPLIFTDEVGLYGETDFSRFLSSGFSEFNVGADSQRSDLILAAAYADPELQSRMLLLGDVDMVRNGTGFAVSPSFSGSFVYPANAQFMVRATAWLLGVEPMNIEQLPTPAATATPTATPTQTPTPMPESSEEVGNE